MYTIIIDGIETEQGSLAYAVWQGRVKAIVQWGSKVEVMRSADGKIVKTFCK